MLGWSITILCLLFSLVDDLEQGVPGPSRLRFLNEATGLLGVLGKLLLALLGL